MKVAKREKNAGPRVIIRRGRGITEILLEGWLTILIMGLAAVMYLVYMLGGS